MTLSEKLCRYDLPHVGALFERVRESRGVQRAAIASFRCKTPGWVASECSNLGSILTTCFQWAVAWAITHRSWVMTPQPTHLSIPASP